MRSPAQHLEPKLSPWLHGVCMLAGSCLLLFQPYLIYMFYPLLPRLTNFFPSRKFQITPGEQKGCTVLVLTRANLPQEWAKGAGPATGSQWAQGAHFPPGRSLSSTQSTYISVTATWPAPGIVPSIQWEPSKALLKTSPCIHTYARMCARTHTHPPHCLQLQEKNHVSNSPMLLELSRPKEENTNDGAPSGNGPRDSGWPRRPDGRPATGSPLLRALTLVSPV